MTTQHDVPCYINKTPPQFCADPSQTHPYSTHAIGFDPPNHRDTVPTMEVQHDLTSDQSLLPIPTMEVQHDLTSDQSLLPILYISECTCDLFATTLPTPRHEHQRGVEWSPCSFRHLILSQFRKEEEDEAHSYPIDFLPSNSCHWPT